jgi:flagellar L-ring protein precursor FlgH
MMRQRINIASLLLASTLLSGCGSMLDKLDNINKPPPLAEVVNPQEKASYQPMSWPMPETPPPPKLYANSLWQPGARAFFRDGRAARVGDILRVNIKINDKAQLDNETEGKRTTGDSAQAAATMGIAEKAIKYLPFIKPVPANLLDINAELDSKGTGKIKRQENINTQVAAIVTQMLPNGNLVIDGKQEINVNFEVREVAIKGVVRPQDINSDNTIDSTQIAEARITYGGRGQMTNAQQPRWGGQVIDAISPF